MSSDAPNGRLRDLLRGGSPGHAALVTAESGATLSYGALDDAVASLAGRLATLGIGRGSRVALVLPDGPAFLQLMLAVVSVGAAAAPLNPAYTHDEYAFYLDDLGPELLLLPAGELPAARSAVGTEVPVVDVAGDPPDGTLALVAADGPVDRGSPFEEGDPGDMALLLHTSGTTSRPKQVPLLQRNLVASARSIAAFYGLGPADAPTARCRSSTCTASSPRRSVRWRAAARWSCPRRFAPRAMWRQLREHGVTWYSAGPTLHQMILDRIDERRRAAVAAVRALVQLGALPRAHGPRRGAARRPDARGVRHDGGEPPDGVEPAAARDRASPARSASRAASRSASSTRKGTRSSTARRARS